VPQLEAIGDSVLVVGDAPTLKIHVHTDDPEGARALFRDHGVVSHVDVADMHEQVAERDERLLAGADRGTGAQQRCGVLAVAAGEGMKVLFEDYGVQVLDGGATLNPSTMELLAGIHEVPAEDVILLPNSANVFMAAERAADLSDKTVQVVPTRSQQAGLLAVASSLDLQGPAEENARRMAASLEVLRTGGVAPAARADPDGRFAVGDALGYIDDALVAWGDPQATVAEVLARLGHGGTELITSIRGAGAPLDDDTIQALLPDGVELEPHDGGQPSWWWLLAAE
jgi:dihydroxyacetone kinase-like predicted kinase